VTPYRSSAAVTAVVARPAISKVEPGQDAGVRLLAGQFGDDAGIENDHRSNCRHERHPDGQVELGTTSFISGK
jgi:hypothetical protein